MIYSFYFTNGGKIFTYVRKLFGDELGYRLGGRSSFAFILRSCDTTPQNKFFDSENNDSQSASSPPYQPHHSTYFSCALDFLFQ
jgi:hypothetical protein